MERSIADLIKQVGTQRDQQRIEKTQQARVAHEKREAKLQALYIQRQTLQAEVHDLQTQYDCNKEHAQNAVFMAFIMTTYDNLHESKLARDLALATYRKLQDATRRLEECNNIIIKINTQIRLMSWGCDDHR